MKLKFILFLLFGLTFAMVSFSCDDDDSGGTVIIDPPDPPKKGYQQYGTPLEHVPAPADVIMYEVNLRGFSNAGDIQGVIGRLDQIQALGVNVIWLMPIHPTGEVNSVNSPYSIRDYKDVAAEYGNLMDLRELTDEAHSRDIAVVMDWVANHTAWDHAWITDHPDWYTQDGQGNIIHPDGTNWLDVADLNFSNTTMRDSMIDAMKYWILEANVDGFRCDYADGVPYDFWRDAIDSLEVIPNRSLVLLAEGARSNHFSAGFGMKYGWSFFGMLKSVFEGQSAQNLWTTHTSEYAGVPVGKHLLRFTTNHDESAWDATPIVHFDGPDGAVAASVAAIFLGGAPLIYTGQEVGRAENLPFFSNDPIDWSLNSEMKSTYENLLQFYRTSAVARYGEASNFSNTNVLCFKKDFEGDELWVIVNVRDQQNNFPLPDKLRNRSLMNSINDEVVDLGTFQLLQPHEYLILE